MRMRHGFTLVEVVVAILVFAVGALGLAASAGALARQISSSTLRSDAGFIARSRSEFAHGSECVDIAGGEARTAGLRSVWSVGGGSAVTLDHRIERTDHRGIHNDRFLTAVPCD